MSDLKNIPLVDMRLKKKDPVAFAMNFGEAMRDFGFVRLMGHGIPEKMIQEADQAGRKFWALPTAVKDQYAHGLYAAGAGNGVCYVRNGEIALSSDKADTKEELGIAGAARGEHSARNMLDAIKEVPDLGAKTMRLYNAFEGVAKGLMGSIAVYSGEKEDRFNQWFREPTAYMRQLYYPQQGNAAGHLDFSMLTLLHVSEPGLMVRNRKGQEFAVTTNKGELVVNGGMQLDLITNLHIRSSWHWVESDRPRTSIPFFLHPMDDVALEPLPKFRGETRGADPKYFPPRDADGFYSILTKDFNDLRRKEIYDKVTKAWVSLKDQLAI